MKDIVVRIVTTLFVAIASLTVGMSVTGKGDERVARETSARVAHLIEMLASKNEAPAIKEYPQFGEAIVDFGSKYDKSAQVSVFLAANRLLDEGEAAFEPLLRRIGDQRYSFSVNSYRDYNVTVGDACEMIVRRNILSFESEIHVVTRSQFGVNHGGARSGGRELADWWQANRGRGLRAVQLEEIDAMLAFMKVVDGRTALPFHAAAAPLPIEEFNRLRDRNVATLKAIRDSIAATGKPRTAKSLEGDNEYFFGLPWTGRRYNK